MLGFNRTPVTRDWKSRRRRRRRCSRRGSSGTIRARPRRPTPACRSRSSPWRASRTPSPNRSCTSTRACSHPDRGSRRGRRRSGRWPRRVAVATSASASVNGSAGMTSRLAQLSLGGAAYAAGAATSSANATTPAVPARRRAPHKCQSSSPPTLRNAAAGDQGRSGAIEAGGRRLSLFVLPRLKCVPVHV